MASKQEKLGLWLIGAAGNIAATVVVGLAALRARRSKPVGLVTELDYLKRLPLASLSRMVLGGHEIRSQRVEDTASELHLASGVFSAGLLKEARSDLANLRRNTRPGTVAKAGPAIASMATRPGVLAGASGHAIVNRLRRDLREFRRRTRVDRLVVVNVASSEPGSTDLHASASWARLSKALARRGPGPVPPSCLYAIAAIEENAAYVNFTPSIGPDLPALRELAEERGVPIMGSDGKTGETLLKTTIAPLFAERNLEVLSWVGHNILGNRDGMILASQANRRTKLLNKQRPLDAVLGYRPRTHTSIEYLPSLHDWKTAWDHIHFRGFLDTKMTLQFIWQGCDSILAAPLVIDLARLAAYHASTGRGGVMTHLACFFKSPMGVKEHQFSRQVEMLRRYVENQARARPSR